MYGFENMPASFAAAGQSGGGGGLGAFSGLWDILKPQSDRERAALWQGLFNVGGSALSAYGQGKMSEADRKYNAEVFRQNTLNSSLGNAAGMFGNGPFDVTQQRQQTMMRYPLLFGGEGGGPMKLSGSPNDPAIRGTYTSPQIGGPEWDAIRPYFTPAAVGNDESFYRNMAQTVAKGQLPDFNYANAGYGSDLGRDYNQSYDRATATGKANQAAEAAALQKALGNDPKKKMDWWKRALLIGGGIGLTAATGGAWAPAGIGLAVQGIKG